MRNSPDIPDKPPVPPLADAASQQKDWRAKLTANRFARSIPCLTDRDSAPLSFAQERLWLLERLDPGNPANNRPLALRLTGELDEGSLGHALRSIITRHKILQSRFASQNGEAAQVIAPNFAFDLGVVELTEPVSADREARARKLATEESLRPFNLEVDPPFRATLLRLTSQDHILLLVFHHIVFDGWSARLFEHELAVLYRKFYIGESQALADLSIQYGDYAQWQRERFTEQALVRDLEYWVPRLEGIAPLDLPTDRPRPRVQTHHGGCVEIALSESLANAAKALGREQNSTLFMVLLAAFQSVLSRYSGLDDIAVGSPVAGRNQVETENLIGLFINLVILRSNLGENPTFRELLGRVRETCRGAYAHQSLSFSKVVEAIGPQRDLGSTPLFQVMFNLENVPAVDVEMPGVRVEEFAFERPVADYELTLEVVPTAGKLKCLFTYNSDLFDRATIERLAGHYQTLLEGAVANPDCRLATLPLMPPSELDTILVEWNRTEADYPREATLDQLFAAQVKRTPDATAFFTESGSVTYGELNQCANQLARHLQAKGVMPESRVGVCLERSVDAVVAMLGALKAGCAYVPLDPTYPAERLAFMISDAQIALGITQRKWMPLLQGTRAVLLDGDRAEIAAQESENLPESTRPDPVANLIYTSGSSGVPKGVLGLHRGAVNRFAWMWENFPFLAGEVCALKTSLNFVDSTWEIFGPLLQGIPSVIVSDATVRDPAELVRTLERFAVTRIVTVPSLLHAVLESFPDLGTRLPALKLWVSSGEALRPELCRRFYSALPNCTLLNLYGTTEISADSTAYIVPKNPDGICVVPLGRPIANTQCYVLDSQFQPVPIAVRGRIYVGGDGLARGYWNRPELTAERFVSNPFSPAAGSRLYATGDQARYLADGTIEYLGRADDQVKVRGHRIELKEIETVVALHPQVAEVVAAIYDDGAGERLMAYIVGRNGRDLPGSPALREFASLRLPAYMVPARFQIVQAFPLTPSGKIDRRRLPALGSPARDERPQVAPQDLLESQLIGIWEELLGVRPIGTESDFFELGGHSLLAARMFDRIQDAYGQRLPLATLFAQPTIKNLAENLRRESISEQQAPIVAVQPMGARPAFFFLHGGVGLYCRKLARLIGQDQPFYAVASRDLVDDPSLGSVEAIANDAVNELISFQPRGPYVLGGYCHGGLIAYEMARQLRQRGLEVGVVILLDAWVPPYFGWLKSVINFGGAVVGMGAETREVLYGRGRNFLVRATGGPRYGFGEFLKSCLRALKSDFLPVPEGSTDAPLVANPSLDPDSHLADRRYRAVLMNYRPGRFAGRVALLRTEDSQLCYPHDSTAGWGRIAGQVDVYNLPGDHITCQTEYVGEVARHIASALDAHPPQAETSLASSEKV